MLSATCAVTFALIGSAASLTVGTLEAGQAETIRVSGSVYDHAGVALPDVSVSLRIPGNMSPAAATTTDKGGAFTFSAVQPGKYELRVGKPGYSSFTAVVPFLIDSKLPSITLCRGTCDPEVFGEPLVIPLIAAPLTQKLTPHQEEPIKTTLCDIVKEPSRFNGRIVQARARIASGFEETVLTDDTCSASIWFAEPPAVLRRGNEYRKMDRLLRRGRYTVTATWTGRFDHENKNGPDPKARLLVGFGHLHLYESQLVLQSVSDVVATKLQRRK